MAVDCQFNTNTTRDNNTWPSSCLVNIAAASGDAPAKLVKNKACLLVHLVLPYLSLSSTVRRPGERRAESPRLAHSECGTRTNRAWQCRLKPRLPALSCRGMPLPCTPRMYSVAGRSSVDPCKSHSHGSQRLPKLRRAVAQRQPGYLVVVNLTAGVRGIST